MPTRPTRHRSIDLAKRLGTKSLKTMERPSASARGYGRRWQRLAKMFLANNPLCVDPFGVHGKWPVVAMHVDHIVPRSTGGTDEWDNLQGLCGPCHSRKTVQCDGGFGRRRERMQVDRKRDGMVAPIE
ncbi:MAG: HNH endonuclease [Planctomycetia bacterium]|nr:HNH endonuclease [Planctomycetia bacterium]MCC7315704.1 HNH endonuclease [Planctomycetota bacterium]